MGAGRILRSLVLAATFAVCSCSGAPEDALVGTWSQVDGTEILQFLADRTVIQEDSGGSMGATFKYVDERRIEVSFGGPAVYAPPRIYEVVLAGEALTLTDASGGARRYRRIEKVPTVRVR